MSPAALHLKWPLGHVGEEEAHIAVPLRLPLGPRCRLREDWGQVPMSCSVVGSGSGPPLAAGSMLVCLVDQPLAHPQSRYLVCPGVDFKDLWVSLICYGL